MSREAPAPSFCFVFRFCFQFRFTLTIRQSRGTLFPRRRGISLRLRRHRNRDSVQESTTQQSLGPNKKQLGTIKRSTARGPSTLAQESATPIPTPYPAPTSRGPMHCVFALFLVFEVGLQVP